MEEIIRKLKTTSLHKEVHSMESSKRLKSSIHWNKTPVWHQAEKLSAPGIGRRITSVGLWDIPDPGRLKGSV
jgi:hypothetical protein